MQKIGHLLLIVMICISGLAQIAPPGADHVERNGVTATRIPAAAAAQADEGNPDVKVWVNTVSDVYHCPGSRWYGNTKQGQYMTQAEAQKKHYRPAYGKVCR